MSKASVDLRTEAQSVRESYKALRRVKSTTAADVLSRSLGLRNVTMDGMICRLPGHSSMVGRARTMRVALSQTGKETARFAELITGAEKSDVLVIDAGRDTSFACWGGNNCARARAKGVAGVVVDGAVRDIDEIEKLRFPVFCRGYTPKSWRGVAETIAMNEPVVCGGAIVRPGDYVLGDRSGVVIIPPSVLVAAASLASKLEQEDAVNLRRILGKRPCVG